MSLTSHHRIVVFAAMILVSNTRPTPMCIFNTEGRRTDGVVLQNEEGVEFRPFSEDYKSLLTAVQLTAANWGPFGTPDHVEVLIPNEDILRTIETSYTMPPDHMEFLRDTASMYLANQAVVDFVTSCLSEYTDPIHPPTWAALSALWRSEGHEVRRFLRTKMREDWAAVQSFETSITESVNTLLNNAANTNQIAQLENEIQQLRAQVQQLKATPATASGNTSDPAARAAVTNLQNEFESARNQTTSQQQNLAAQLAALQQTMAAASAPLAAANPTVATNDALSPDAILTLAKAIAAANAPSTKDEDFTADILTWGGLRERYGSWHAVRDRLYQALHVVPQAQKAPILEATFTAFHDLYGIVFERWETVEALRDPSNGDIVEALNGALRRFIVAAKAQQGLRLKSDMGRLNVAADPMDLTLQRSIETTFRTTFVQQNVPPRNTARFNRGGGGRGRGTGSAGRGNATGNGYGGRAAGSTTAQ